MMRCSLIGIVSRRHCLSAHLGHCDGDGEPFVWAVSRFALFSPYSLRSLSPLLLSLSSSLYTELKERQWQIVPAP